MNPLRSIMLALQRIPTPALLLIFVILAGLIAFTVNNYMTETKRQAEAQKTTYQAEFNAKEAALTQKLNQRSRVVYSVKDIPEGSTIAADSLEEKDVTGQVSPDALSGMASAIGRIAKYNISAGQLISAHDLTVAAMTMGFESKVKEGYRAVTFGIDNNSGVAGFISPGSHVDIVAITGVGETTKARPIMSDVEIIAVGQMYQKAATKGSQAASSASSVTVTVTADDANKLIKGIIAGKLYLTLRNSNDHRPVAVVDINSLYEKTPGLSLGGPLPLPPGAPSVGGPSLPPLHEIEFWNGSKKEILPVPKN